MRKRNDDVITDTATNYYTVAATFVLTFGGSLTLNYREMLQGINNLRACYVTLYVELYNRLRSLGTEGFSQRHFIQKT